MKKERDELSKSLQVIEKDLKKTVADIQPKKLQAAFKKMVEAIESKKLIQDEEDSDEDLKEELAELATQLEVKCEEVLTYKLNFERLQVRTVLVMAVEVFWKTFWTPYALYMPDFEVASLNLKAVIQFFQNLCCCFITEVLEIRLYDDLD